MTDINFTSNADGDHKPTGTSRRKLVLIHGAGHDRTVWSPVIDHLKQAGLDPVALDLPGHGESDAKPCKDIEAMARWLIDELQASTDEPVAIAGHSMGSLIALEACARSPDLFSHLILIGSAFPMPVASALLEAARDEPESAYDMINKWSFSPDSSESLRADNLALMCRQAPGVLHADLAACNNYIKGLESAQVVECPVCLISGAADKMTPVKSTTLLRQALEQARSDVPLVVLEHTGHAIMAEQPSQLVKAIGSWLPCN